MKGAEYSYPQAVIDLKKKRRNRVKSTKESTSKSNHTCIRYRANLTDLACPAAKASSIPPEKVVGDLVRLFQGT